MAGKGLQKHATPLEVAAGAVSGGVRARLRDFRMSAAKAIPKIIIAGAPASGKGTQCEMLKEKYGVVHLSTGDILRAAVKEGTPLGQQAKGFMDRGCVDRMCVWFVRSIHPAASPAAPVRVTHHMT